MKVGFIGTGNMGGALAELYKGTFFVLRAAHDARAGYRAVSRRDLLPRLWWNLPLLLRLLWNLLLPPV